VVFEVGGVRPYEVDGEVVLRKKGREEGYFAGCTIFL